MIREGILIAVALLYSAAVVALGRRLARPASVTAYVTALATLVAVLLLSMSTARWVDDLLSVIGAGRLLFYLALMTQQCGLFLTIILGTHQWATSPLVGRWRRRGPDGLFRGTLATREDARPAGRGGGVRRPP